MKAERLLALYESVAEAPDAIARLRRFVLDLAVRGKLVLQDPADEPASELLKRIAAEKAQLVKTGEILKEKPLPPVSTETPFPLPCGWAWSRLGSLVLSSDSGWSPRTETHARKGDAWGVLKVSAVSWDHFDPSANKQVLPGTEPRLQAQVREGDFLISRANTAELVARAVLVLQEPRNLMMSDKIVRLRLAAGCDYRFAWLVNNYGDYARAYYAIKATGVSPSMKNVSRAVILNLPIALPSFAEQRRIVAKVEELMALLDRLAVARQQREATRDRLTTASLARLTAHDTDAEAFPTHARFALDALPALTARPDQIKTLRQTILNLAVRGRLVPQDPADEPASELLKRIRKWQRQAIENREIRAPRKPLAPVDHVDFPYILPTGWAFARLGEIIYIRSGDGLTVENMLDGPVPVFGGNGINGYHDQNNVYQPTIVIGRVGYYCGSIHVTPPKAWVTDNAFITHFSQNEIFLRFLVLLLNATNLKEDENATAQPVISGSKIYPIVVGLPPLAEQHRIVAKVDALMALCDRLQAALTTADTTRARLLEALLHEALAPATEAAMEAAE